ncbi:MAG: TonB-dependent receptor [Pseudomonadota bacterium]
MVTATDTLAEEAMLLDTITVTGERRARSLQETTSAVTVIDGVEAERNGGDTRIDEIVTRTPNVFIEGPSEVPTIRGVQGGGAGGLPSTSTTGALPRTAIIRDGIARPAFISNSSFTSLWDVEQVEVLRGPQTLLRGRTGFAGAVVIETKDPTFEFEAAGQGGVRIDGFNGPEYTANGVISGPILENVAGRFSFETAGGDDPRDIIGEGGDFITEYDRYAFRGKLLGDFETDFGGLQIELMAEHQFGQTPQTRNNVLGPGAGFDPEDRQYLATGPARTFDTEATSIVLDATLDGEGWTLNWLTGFTSDAFESVPEQIEPTRFDVDEQIYNQDIILTLGPQDRLFAGDIGAIFGLSFEERRSDLEAAGLLSSTLDVESHSQAIFGEMRFGATDRITLEAGARVQRFADERVQTSSIFFPPLGGFITGLEDYDEVDLEFLPRLGASYKLTEEQIVSASLRRGYNPGGASVNFFTGQPYQYESETVWTAEATYRANLASPRLTLGATAFYNRFDNPQFFAEVIPGNRTTLQVVNQEKGRSFGAEFEVAWEPLPGLVMDGSLGLLDTKITEAAASTPGLEGNSFGQDPSVTASIGAQYAVLDWLSIDGRLTYRGESENDFNNVTGDEVGDYVILDLGATAVYGPAELRVFVNNVSNTTGITRRVSDSAFVDVTDPITGGLTLTVRF